MRTAFLNAVEVAEPTVSPVAPVKTQPAKKEKVEDIQKRGRKPPKDGPCKGCGQNKPLNRLMLCYPCWVKKRLRDEGWREGQPHPSSCKCDLDCRFDSHDANN